MKASTGAHLELNPDTTIFRAVTASLPMNLQMIAGDGFFFGLDEMWDGRIDEWGEKV